MQLISSLQSVLGSVQLHTKLQANLAIRHKQIKFPSPTSMESLQVTILLLIPSFSTTDKQFLYRTVALIEMEDLTSLKLSHSLHQATLQTSSTNRRLVSCNTKWTDSNEILTNRSVR